MRKLFIFILLMLSLSSMAFAQKKVAVYVTGNDDGINKVLGDKLVDAFVKHGRYTAIERTHNFLAELSKEQSYQRSGAVSDDEISELGKQFGVDYVCVADVYSVFGENYVSARLIDVETVEIINSTNVHSTMNNMDDLTKVSNTITTALTSKTTKEMLEEKALIDSVTLVKTREVRMKYSAEERELQSQLKKGYLKAGDYYITFPLDDANLTWKEAKSIIKTCNVGDFNDWRLPSTIECKQIATVMYDYIETVKAGAKSVSKYPNIQDDLEHLYYIVCPSYNINNFIIWVSDEKHGKGSAPMMLIRNAK